MDEKTTTGHKLTTKINNITSVKSPPPILPLPPPLLIDHFPKETSPVTFQILKVQNTNSTGDSLKLNNINSHAPITTEEEFKK